jgi:hypothetical protein
MFQFGFTANDLKRTVWTVIQAGIAAVIVFASAQSQFPDTWSGAKEVAWGAGVAFLAGAFAFVKNLLLSDTSRLK